MSSASPERLDIGRDPGPRDPRRVAAAAAVGVVLVVVLVVVLLIDRGVRSREAERVSACVSAARGAVTYSSARVTAILSYVRPVLVRAEDAALRRRLLRVVSEAVAPTIPEVLDARERCERTRVLRVHLELRARRADCLELLDADLTYLRAVAADGSEALTPPPLRTRTCAPSEPPS